MNPITKAFIEFFEFFDLYSRQNGLGEHLKGMTQDCSPMAGQSIYSVIFLYLIMVNTLIVVNYYYGFFNRIPFNRWMVWLINILGSSVILFVIAFTYSHNDLVNQRFCADLQITVSDCIGFGITAAICSVIYSVVVSYLIKYWSSINRIVNPFYFF